MSYTKRIKDWIRLLKLLMQEKMNTLFCQKFLFSFYMFYKRTSSRYIPFQHIDSETDGTAQPWSHIIVDQWQTHSSLTSCSCKCLEDRVSDIHLCLYWVFLQWKCFSYYIAQLLKDIFISKQNVLHKITCLQVFINFSCRE